MGLLNVRLDAEDERRAKALREAGVPVSTLVRDAIRREYERRLGRRRGRVRASQIVEAILADLPDPPNMQTRTLDLRDRKAVRNEIVRALRKRR